MAAEYFILIAADVHKSKLSEPSAEKVAKLCFGRKAWGISHRMPFRRTLSKGDKALIYLAGVREHNKSFIASAEIASGYQSQSLQISDKWWDFTVALNRIQLFSQAVPIKPLLKRLKFISNPTSNKWGCLFQGGIVRICKQDFELIVREQHQKRNV